MPHVSAVQRAIDAIRERIGSGEWATGTRLPSETELSALLGISRSPLREAVRALVHTGLLSVRRGDGTYVTATDEISAVLTHRALGSRVADVIEVRAGLDAVCAGLAAQRRTAGDLEALAGALAQRRAAAEDGDRGAFAEADARFHLLVAQAAHNPLLSAVYSGLVGALVRSVDSELSLEHAVRDRGQDHDALLNAIEACDAVRAEAVALEILRDQGRAAESPE